MKNERPASAPRGGICWHYPILILIVGGSMASCFLQTKSSDAKTKPQEWRESRGPVVPHDSFPRDCTICHAKGSWHEIRSDFVFDHAKETGTPLNGAHGMAQCLRCHNDRGSVATFAKRGCTGCHEDIHRGRLGINCTTCHSEGDWNPTGVYAVHAKTRFPLQGAHVGVSCSRCHPSAESGQFLGADPRCEACHQQEAINAKISASTGKTHSQAGIITNCQQCHDQSSWLGSAHFSHAGITAACTTCHQNDLITANKNITNHATFGTNCIQCHNPNSGTWLAAFNHTGIAKGICASCHTKDLPANHVSDIGIFGGSCDACHTSTTSWLTYTFNHPPPFVVPHHGQACFSCHTNTATFKTWAACIQCHQSAFNNNHSKGDSTDCTACHDPAGLTWSNPKGGKAILLKAKPPPPPPPKKK